MPRPQCPRRVRDLPARTYFKPRGVPVAQLGEVSLTVDEFEAIRLADLDGLYHEAAATEMNVSRPTFGRILEAARRKVAEALVQGKALKIGGGAVELPEHRVFSCSTCNHSWQLPFGTGRPPSCPSCGSATIQRVHEASTEGGPPEGACEHRQRPSEQGPKGRRRAAR